MNCWQRQYSLICRCGAQAGPAGSRKGNGATGTPQSAGRPDGWGGREFLALVALVAWGLGAQPLPGAVSAPEKETGDSVVVIYNARMPESKEVAEYYAARRHVPSNQIFGFELPVTEEISRQDYLDQLQNPLLEMLQTAGLWRVVGEEKGRLISGKASKQNRRLEESRIRYALLCYGVPTKIREEVSLPEQDLEDLKPPLRRNNASVDSQLACLPQGLGAGRWTGPIPNPHFRATNAAVLHPTNGILLVTRLDGPSPEVARRLVDLAMEGETNGLWGRAYFDARGLTNGPLLLGDAWIRNAERVCRVWGFETELDTNEAVLPVGQALSDVAIYAGWYASHVSGALGAPKIDFQPGAFAYHLHSFSAQVVRSSTTHWVGPLLYRGAAATIGYVHEPYLAFTVDLQVFFSRWLFRQFSFGEAAWAAMNSLSWQSLAIGDPLYRPFARSPQQLHIELQRRGSPLVDWSHLLVVNRNQTMNAPLDQLIHYLQSLPRTRQSAVLTEKLGDLYWDQKHFSDALDTYDLALERHPTPPQQKRLLLRLARLRNLFGPETKVLDYYRTLLETFPDYPDKLTVYRTLLPVARRVGDKNLAERCENEIKRLSPE